MNLIKYIAYRILMLIPALLIAVIVGIFNLISDIALAIADPRIRLK